MIPLLLHSHWHLCVYNTENKELSIRDPLLNYTTVESLTNRHLSTLKSIEERFLKVHYKRKTGKAWIEATKSVYLPPEIPEQEDFSNCGPFMCKLARFETFDARIIFLPNLWPFGFLKLK